MVRLRRCSESNCGLTYLEACGAIDTAMTDRYSVCSGDTIEIQVLLVEPPLEHGRYEVHDIQDALVSASESCGFRERSTEKQQRRPVDGTAQRAYTGSRRW